MFSFIQPDWIVFAAGITFVLGYLIINQVALRLMVALGTFLYIWYYIVALEDPKAAVITSVLMGIANFIGLSQIWYRNSKWAIPEEHADIYPRFSTLPPGDFKALLQVGQRAILDDDRTVTVEGEVVENLYFILDGKVTAEKFGESFDLPTNIFVGEVAYMRKQKASATTTIASGAEVLVWNITGLNRKAGKNDRFRLALDALISQDLASKVTVAVAPKGYQPTV